jgi:hypothetical protein
MDQRDADHGSSPVVLGSGKRLFAAGAVPSALRLVSSTVSGTGVVMGIYDPAGAAVTRSFGARDHVHHPGRRRTFVAEQRSTSDEATALPSTSQTSHNPNPRRPPPAERVAVATTSGDRLGH